MIELTKDQVQALEDVGITEADVVDGRRVEEGDVVVVSSAGQKVLISDGVATITMGPGFVAPEVVQAPAVVEPESTPVVEDLKPVDEGGADGAVPGSDATTPEGDGADAGATAGGVDPEGIGDDPGGVASTDDQLPPIDDDESTLVQSFGEMKVEQLKGLLRDRGLPVLGKKDELIDRLNAAE